MSLFTPDQVRAAVAQHNTIFFNHLLQPVQPQDRQWFCEFHIDETCDGEEVRDQELVEYVGEDESHTFGANGMETRKVHCVVPDGDDSDREPRGDILILQH